MVGLVGVGMSPFKMKNISATCVGGQQGNCLDALTI